MNTAHTSMKNIRQRLAEGGPVGGTNQSMEQQYLDVMSQILDEGNPVGDRTGTGTREIFGPQLRCDLADGFPILSTKKVRYRKAFAELAWMCHGHTNVQVLQSLDVNYWNDWADGAGELGPVYGAQWRDCHAGHDAMGRIVSIDQLAGAVQMLREDPTSRRIIVDAWNVAELQDMRLPPCHLYFQFNVARGRLNLMMLQRSADWFLGVPFNIIQYAAMNHLMAHLVGLEPGELIMNFGSAHLYNNHLDQATEQLKRTPMVAAQFKVLDEAVHSGSDLLPEGSYRLEDFDHLCPEHMLITSYTHHPAIAAPISV